MAGIPMILFVFLISGVGSSDLDESDPEYDPNFNFTKGCVRGESTITKDWICKYHGVLKYGEPCWAEIKKQQHIKEYIDMDESNITSLEEDRLTNLLDQLDQNSCSVFQYTECRVNSSIPPPQTVSNSSSRYQCLCPDYEEGDSEEAVFNMSKAYFHYERQICVIPARIKCRNFKVPMNAERFNSEKVHFSDTIKVRVSDGRPAYSFAPCVTNAKCNNGSDLELDPPEWFEIDHTKDKCVCNKGFIAGEEGECYKIPEPEAWAARQIHGLFWLCLAFGVFFWRMLFVVDADLYYERGHKRSQ